LVPAHDEEAHIARTVASLAAAASAGPVAIVVVADNCSDRTATCARRAGATVLERTDDVRRGKSYALDFGLAQIRGAGSPPEMLVVVDADTTVDPAFFDALWLELEGGAAVLQARYDTSPARGDVARLRALAFGLVHYARPLGFKRFGLPTTLKGNGMAFRWDVVRDGLPGSGITEDASATLAFARRGIAVTFVPLARVSGLMADGYAGAATQDRRWEGGRSGLWPQAARVAIRALVHRRATVAAAVEIASPPLTAVGLGGVAAATIGLAGFGSKRAGIFALGSLIAYVAVGLVAARPARRDVAALVHTPRFVAHKLAVFASLLGGRPRAWERTQRPSVPAATEWPVGKLTT
jgi:hypothetical protein